MVLGLTGLVAWLIVAHDLWQRPVGVTDYLTLAWIISSMATVGGAIGSGLEDEDTVRAAAYGFHPEPAGWREGLAAFQFFGGIVHVLGDPKPVIGHRLPVPRS